ncbi:MAG: flippase [Erysipelotrichaceae bacterium]|nr:flippase [Erysipelotrichaceae bacterium]
MNRVAKNATWIIACRIVQAVFALIINMLTARYLGPSNFGLITYASSLVAFVLPIMQLGFSNILVQEIVNDPEHEGKILGTSMFLSCCSSICCMIGVTTFAYIANHNEPATIIVCFLYSFILFFQALDLMQYWFQAKFLSKYTSIVGLCAYVLVTAYKVYLLATAKSVYWFALSNAFDYALISISIIVIYHKLGGQKLSFSLALGKEMFSRSKHYILSSMMVTIFAQTDKIMIKLMIGEAATGYYGAAIACAAMTSFVFAAIIDSFRPSIFEGMKINNSVFEHRLTVLYSIIIYISLAQSVFMTVLAKVIIHVLYGAAYSPAIGALQIVVWYTTFSYIGSIRNIWILANNKQNYLWRINLMGAVSNIILNAIFIPIIGIYGAAFASLITQFFTNVIVGYIIKPISPNNRIMINGLNPRIIVRALRNGFRRKTPE